MSLQERILLQCFLFILRHASVYVSRASGLFKSRLSSTHRFCTRYDAAKSEANYSLLLYVTCENRLTKYRPEKHIIPSFGRVYRRYNKLSSRNPV